MLFRSTAATIYLSLLGAEGLRRVALACHANTRRLVTELAALPGVSVAYEPFFHEAVLTFDRPVAPVLEALESRGILGGLDLGTTYTDGRPALLVCATENRTAEDIGAYAAALGDILGATRAA